MNPLVSIVIPSFNHAEYIIPCLDSVISDTYEEKEIVIIDDGSKDQSVYKIRGWIEKHNKEIKIRFIVRENKGICATLNELIELAAGKYIVPLASDDMLINDTIRVRVKMLEESYPKMVLVGDAQVIDRNNNVIANSSLADYNKGNKLNYFTDEGIISESIINPGISGATVMINKEIYSIIGKYPINLPAEDWFFYQRAAALKKILFWDIVVSKYRVHGNNISGINSDSRAKLFKAIIKTYLINFYWFPTIKFKFLAFFQLVKFTLMYCKRSLTCKN